MMKSQIKSRTNWAGVLVMALGVVETNAPMLRDLLGDWYGLTYIGIGVAMVILRQVTTGPVGHG